MYGWIWRLTLIHESRMAVTASDLRKLKHSRSSIWKYREFQI